MPPHAKTPKPLPQPYVIHDGLIHRHCLAIFFSFLFFRYASMALFVEHTVLLVGSFHGWLGVGVVLEFAQGRVA